MQRRFGPDEIIVGKTHPKGRTTCANDAFLRIADCREVDVLGQPHSLIRHPDMPRCVFKLLWDTVAPGREIVACVVTLARTGDHYRVLAHVTPDIDALGSITGYPSNRRAPRSEAVAAVATLYRELCGKLLVLPRLSICGSGRASGPPLLPVSRASTDKTENTRPE